MELKGKEADEKFAFFNVSVTCDRRVCQSRCLVVLTRRRTCCTSDVWLDSCSSEEYKLGVKRERARARAPLIAQENAPANFVLDMKIIKFGRGFKSVQQANCHSLVGPSSGGSNAEKKAVSSG